jgi:predicted ArsR family transcriptional regulator
MPLRPRIIGALRLQPMSVRTLSSVLSATYHGTWRRVDELAAEGRITPAGHTRGAMGAPSTTWRLT